MRRELFLTKYLKTLPAFFRRSRELSVGTFILFSFLIVPFLVLIYPYSPFSMQFKALQPPSFENPFGTDAFGRDVFAQFIQGVGYSFKIGIITGLIACFIGIMLGSIGGYYGGVIDEFFNLISNVMLTIPTIALLIVSAAFFRMRSEWLVILMISITSWPWTARSVRVQVLSLKTREYVDLARISGLSKIKITLFEVLPNMASYIVMAFTLQVANAITSEAALSAIGLGPTEILSLGQMLRWAIMWEAARYGAWWWFIAAGLPIALISLSVLLINDGLDEMYNPRIRRR